MGRGAMPPPLRAAAHFFNNSEGKSTIERIVSDFLRSWIASGSSRYSDVFDFFYVHRLHTDFLEVVTFVFLCLQNPRPSETPAATSGGDRGGPLWGYPVESPRRDAAFHWLLFPG